MKAAWYLRARQYLSTVQWWVSITGYEHEDLCAGLGIKVNSSLGNIRCDVAYMKHKTLDSTLRYSLAMEF